MGDHSGSGIGLASASRELVGALALLTLVLFSFTARASSPTAASIDGWIDDLQHDDVQSNARVAVGELLRAGNAATPALERALLSRDPQQRHFAAHVLRATGAKNPVAHPTARLLQITIEGLRDDGVPDDVGLPPYIYNAREGVDFLLKHVDAARQPLEAAVASTDGQQRFLASYVIAASGRTWKLDRVTALLIEHLEDNSVRNDASFACYALRKLGASALPALRARSASNDEQQRFLVGMLIDHIQFPPRNDRQFTRPKFGVLYDPLSDTPPDLNIPTIPRRARWRAIESVIEGRVPLPSVDALRKKLGSALMLEELEHGDDFSIIGVGGGAPYARHVYDPELYLRVEYDGTVYRKDGENADGKPRWVLEYRSERRP